MLADDAGREEAEKFFLDMGFRLDTQLEWDDAGGLVVTNHHPGFFPDKETGEDVWWNIAHTGALKTMDGTSFPKKMVQGRPRIPRPASLTVL